MADEVANLLLRISGEDTGGEDTLQSLLVKLKEFDQEEAEATADVDTSQADKDLDELLARLEKLNQTSESVDVDVATAGALSHMRAFRAQLDVLSRDEEVNVDTDSGAASLRGFLGFVKNTWNSIGSIFEQGAIGVSKSMVGFGGSVSTEGTASLSAMGKVVGPVAAAIGVVLVAAIGAAVVALVALAASAAAAVGALGALAVAGLALIAPAALLAVGAIANFKEEADKAGTAANKLKQEAKGIGEAFKTALGPAARAIFGGIAAGLQGVIPLIRSLKGEFTTFGQTVGLSIQSVLGELTSPAWRNFFAFLISSATAAIGPITVIFIALARILRNIARAAMPFLIAGFRSVAGSLSGLAAGTGHANRLNNIVGTLVGHLRSWLNLIGQLSGLMLGFLKAVAPMGQQLVDWLAEGVEKIKDWVNSAEGQDRIKQFFQDTMPLVKQIITLFAQLAVIAIELFQFFAPAMTSFITALNLVLKPVIFLLDLLNRIPASIRSWMVPFTGVFSSISSIVSAVSSLPGLFSAIGPAVGAAAGAVKSVGVAAFNAFVTSVKTAFGAVKGFVTGAINAVVVQPFLARARLIGQGIVAGINIAKAIGGRIASFINDAIGKIAGAVGSIISRATQLGKGVITGFVNGAAQLARTVFDKIHGVADGIRSFVGDFVGLGEALINAVKDGVVRAASGLADAAKNAIGNALQAARDKLPGSEPKDKSSPFVHLDRSGEAIINNLVAGIETAGPRLAAALGGLNPILAPSIVGGGPVAPVGSAAAVAPVTIDGGHQFTIISPEGELPDTEAMLAQIDAKLRARGVWGS